MKSRSLFQIIAPSLMLSLVLLGLGGGAAWYAHRCQSQTPGVSSQNEIVAERIAAGCLLLGACGAVASLLTGYAVTRAVRHTVALLHGPIRKATGKLEEVVGPVDLEEPQGLHDLASSLTDLADRVVTVVDQLQQNQLELLRAEQLAALGQLAAGLAHELRNPLTAIKILVQTAAEAGEGATLEGRDVVVLKEELARLEDSLQRFLDFAKPPSLEKRRFDLRDVVRNLLDLISARVALQQVRLQSELPQDPVEIWADREQIRQLLLNTMLNALDAVGHGGEISVALNADGAPDPPATESDQCPWATVLVRDSGPGIPVELENRIFEPFVSTKETGLGLGLAICRRIAEAHGGRIQAANSCCGGAVLSISLPTGAPCVQFAAQE